MPSASKYDREVRPGILAVADAARTLQFVVAAARKEADKDDWRISVSVQAKEDDDGNYDEEEITIRCDGGGTEGGATACSDILAPLDEEDDWTCTSDKDGAECTHTPH